MKTGHDPILLLSLNLLIQKLADQCSVIEAANSLGLSQHQRLKILTLFRNLTEDLNVDFNDWLRSELRKSIPKVITND